MIATAKPSQPLVPTVCIAAASRRGLAPMISSMSRTARACTSSGAGSRTRPKRAMLSTTMIEPARPSLIAHSTYAMLFSLSASMKIRSNGSPSSSVGNVSSAAPTITSTRSSTPARARFCRATSACAGSYSSVTTRPPAPTPRASWMVLYPASVPISSTRLARIAVARRNSSFPCWADTSIAGIPAAAPRSRAAVSASSSVRNTRLNISSSAFGSGSVTRQTLPHTFFGVHDPQYVGDLRSHHRFGDFAERRDELRPVRRFGVAQVVGNLVQYDELAQRPRRAPIGHRDRGAVVVGALVVGGGGPASGPHRQWTVDADVRQHVVHVALHRRRRREPPFRRKSQLGTEEVDDAVTAFGRAVEQRPYEFFRGVYLCPLRVARRHFSNAERAPASSSLLSNRARLPALSPARRAADE